MVLTKQFQVTLLSLLGLATTASAQMSMEQFLTNQNLVQLGQESYVKRCSGCHGLNGDATSASPFLNPKPRNFTTGTFKFRSTPNGSLPTDQDLYRTITMGVLGTSMPSFKMVPETEKVALVQYIKTLSPIWKDLKEPPQPVTLPAPPDGLFTQKSVFLARAKSGREMYAKSCALCHGHDGRGFGPAAATLQDEWGNPTTPVDFTKPYVRSGYDARDIYRVMKTGLNGTPMAAFYEALGEEKTWDVVAYVMYIRGEAAGIYPKGTLEPIPAPPPLPPSEE